MLFNFWGKKKKQQNNELYYNFDFPCEKIAERMNNSQYTQKWKNCSRQNGFPVFIIFNKIAKELFENNVYSFEEIDIEKYLNDAFEKAKIFAEENGEDFY